MVIAGCMTVRKPSAEELRALDQPPPDVAMKIDEILPRALDWYERIEAQLSLQGRPLSSSEAERARNLGVNQPERVRVVVLNSFPMPEDPQLQVELERYGLGSHFVGARTIGYAIMFKPEYAGDSIALSHELVHVSQHERLGRTAFVRRYLVEMEIMGYLRSPLELEAFEKQGSIR